MKRPRFCLLSASENVPVQHEPLESWIRRWLHRRWRPSRLQTPWWVERPRPFVAETSGNKWRNRKIRKAPKMLRKVLYRKMWRILWRLRMNMLKIKCCFIHFISNDKSNDFENFLSNEMIEAFKACSKDLVIDSWIFFNLQSQIFF